MGEPGPFPAARFLSELENIGIPRDQVMAVMRDAGVDPESALSQAQVDYVADATTALAEPLDMPGKASSAGPEAGLENL